VKTLSGFFDSLAIRPGGRRIPVVPLTIGLACAIGVLGGYGSILFTLLIDLVTDWTVRPIVQASVANRWWLSVLWAVPAVGLLLVSWFTRRFAPEAQGHGIPEVIYAIGRHDGVIRPRVSVVKILASGFCIGTGGSIGREGPIVQIGSSLGSMAGQVFKLTPRNVKVLVAAGAAAGISATFNAPLAGVMFASEIILGSFAVESLTPIVVASVLANVVIVHAGEHGVNPAFPNLYHEFQGAWQQLPSYFLLGLLCGLAAVGFTKLLYIVDDVSQRWLPRWWQRALILGGLVGLAGAVYPLLPPQQSRVAESKMDNEGQPLPPLFGVGYGVIRHALHLETVARPSSIDVRDLVAFHGVTIEDLAAFFDVTVEEIATLPDVTVQDLITRHHKTVEDLAALLNISAEELSAFPSLVRKRNTLKLDPAQMLAQFWWLLPLALLKPLMTSLTLGGGGSGGIFAPSLFLGATLGASFGLICNLFLPETLSADPGVYAIVGMGAVVAGTTHGTLSAILIVYEMTNDYRIILPIMITAGLAGVVARLVDPDSIYLKKLSRREQSIARGHDIQRLEHIMVRDVMIRHFPTVRHTDDLAEIVRVARANSHIECLPVMNDKGKLVGIIRPGDLQRVLDSEIAPHLVNAGDISMMAPISLPTNANLLEALRDFGACDVETLPVESRVGGSSQIVGLVLRSDVMRRYREEMLRRR